MAPSVMSPGALHPQLITVHSAIWIFTVVILLLAIQESLTDVTVTAATESCCENVVDNPECFGACAELSTGSTTDIQLRQLSVVARTCPESLILFWQCINHTFPVVSGGAEKWSGKTCCDLALQSQCHTSCKKAKSRDDLNHCRPNEQATFFHCLDRQELAVQCCGPAESAQCRATCKALFVDSTPSQRDIQNVRDFCTPSIVSCVENYTRNLYISPEEAVPCCEYSSSESCRQKCQQAMLSDLKDEDKYNLVTSECEEATLGTEMWNCLLRLSAISDQHQFDHGGRIDLIGMDNAKLQCCTRALTNKCQDLCAQVFSNAWDRHYSQFLSDCKNNPKEAALAHCIDEVELPCQMGCSGLGYCTSFNNRPMELFQSCTADADMSARQLVQMWSSGTIIFPNIEHFLPIKDITKCRPEVWPAIACTLHVKPCQSMAPTSLICRSDCLSILNECIDKERLSPGVSAESFCNLLSPIDVTAPCVSMDAYLADNPYTATISEITTPCNPNPCSSDEICMLQRKKCKHIGDPDCKLFQCKRACKMGEISTFLVPHRTFVRISRVNQEEVNVNCHQGCKCGHHNQILNCKDMGCIEPDECLLRSGRIQNHNSQFMLGCNQCACYGGEMMCTMKMCLSKRATEAELHLYTGLPCNCAPDYDPVCGSNGQTFPNQCIADCLGFSENYIGGTCKAIDPCQNNPCGQNERCLPRRDVCISSRSGTCRQYECVNDGSECSRHGQSVACDSNNDEFTDVCTLLSQGKQFKHWGHCMATCGSRNLVCGMNGVTYANECEAWADGIYADYYGTCRDVGQLLNLKSGEPSCPNIQCPALPTGANCRPITLPGTCCPKCVGEVRILWSHTQADIAARVVHTHQVTVRDVIEVCRTHIGVIECDAFGYLSIEGDLVVVIAPITAYPTALQIQACMAEAEKIGFMISSRSPLFMMHLPSASFVSANTRTSYVVLSSASHLTTSPHFTFLIVTLSILLTITKQLCDR